MILKLNQIKVVENIRDILNNPEFIVNDIEKLKYYIDRGEESGKVDRIKNMLADQINSHSYREDKVNYLLDRLSIELSK